MRLVAYLRVSTVPVPTEQVALRMRASGEAGAGDRQDHRRQHADDVSAAGRAEQGGGVN